MFDPEYVLMRRGQAAMRQVLAAHHWDGIATAIAADREVLDRPFRRSDSDIDRSLGSVDGFRRTGIARLPLALDRDLIGQLCQHLETIPTLTDDAYWAGRTADAQPLAETKRRSQFAYFRQDDILRAPMLIDILNLPAIVDFAEQYLGCVPTLYSVNAWWSFPAPSAKGLSTQFFHRDYDDWRFCALFIHLTDVDGDSGPHQIIQGSHTLSGMAGLVDEARRLGRDTSGFDFERSFKNINGAELSSTCERLFGERVTSVTGGAGTMFLANPLALHRGLLPATKPRLMLWARYGLGPNSNSKEWRRGALTREQIPAVLPDTPRNRYINRLLFDWASPRAP